MKQALCECGCGGPSPVATRTDARKGWVKGKPGGLYFRVTDGRWIVNLRDGSKQLFSRCLMEGYVGRRLAYDEVVHHVNGDRTDDRIENLQIVSRVEHPTLHVAEMRAGCARRKALLKAHGRAGFDGHSELAPTGRYGR